MSREVELKELIVRQHLVLGAAGSLLAEIGQSKSKYADEAWAIFSQVFAVTKEVSDLVYREMPPQGTMQ